MSLRSREWSIFEPERYLRDARRFEDEGEIVEAMWCYEALLKDRTAPQGHPSLRMASLGLAYLLINESRTSRDTLRTTRLLNRAISVLSASGHADGRDGEMTLALTEAHALRYALAGGAHDLLAANMLLDAIAEAPALTHPGILESADVLRQRLVALRTAVQLPLR
jgi:hypothetical protein